MAKNEKVLRNLHDKRNQSDWESRDTNSDDKSKKGLSRRDMHTDMEKSGDDVNLSGKGNAASTKSAGSKKIIEKKGSNSSKETTGSDQIRSGSKRNMKK